MLKPRSPTSSTILSIAESISIPRSGSIETVASPCRAPFSTLKPPPMGIEWSATRTSPINSPSNSTLMYLDSPSYPEMLMSNPNSSNWFPISLAIESVPCSFIQARLSKYKSSASCSALAISAFSRATSSTFSFSFLRK